METPIEGFTVPQLQALELQVGQVQTDMGAMRGNVARMEGNVTKIADAITKIVLLDERSQVQAAQMERIANQVEKIDERQRNSEVNRDQLVRLSTRLDLVEEKGDTTHVGQIKFEAQIEGMSKTLKMLWAAFGTGALYVIGNFIQLIVQRHAA